ncbi:MAG: asparagine synthase (glutamine-hydrolyzing) [Candidatus Obscuribacterales bacterium]|nr:asparagine synthase (glutamine-hydrolyzing) [Candidatus Obscuribacterales bacterium]
MCGIVGYMNLSGKPLDPTRNFLPAMCRSIHHRGPDDSGELIIGPAAIGMTRLSIIDLSTGHQPISNEDGSIWIVFNGEIYNYQDLQKLVLSKGHTLRTSSDTEVIVHLYEEYGVDCLELLEGMFAFAIWDRNKERFLVARDRMGEKPLHYGVFDGQMVFGSELKGLLAHPSVSKELSPEALQKYLALEYVPAPLSIFKGIRKLMPAHYLIVENGQVQTACYWQPKVSKEKLSEGEAQEKLVSLLSTSTKLRLIADVPVGVFLSGGIDSSVIAALASQVSSEQIKTFSIGFSDSSFDESSHAEKVAKHLGTEHNLAWFSPQVARATLEELWNFLDEPIADASVVPTYFLSKMTREMVKVALAGEGGDELFGGYPTYQAHRLAGMWRRIPASLRTNIIEPMVKKLPVSMNNLSFDYKAKRFIESANMPPIERHLGWMGSLPFSEQMQLVRPEIIALKSKEDILPDVLSMPGSNGAHDDVVSQIMKLDMITYLPDDLLVKSDRSSMAASLEVRLPFLAYPLVEFALSLPASYKVRGMTTKYLLKKAAAPYLPESILKRPKKGFGIPVGKWLNNDFKPLVDELLSESFIKRQGLFDWKYIERLRLEHEESRFDRRKELWTIFMFQWWWRKFLA